MNNTTKASFGWINANFMKEPLSYQNFNSIGIHSWYNDPALSSLPHWNGSIVQTYSTLNNDDASTGYYNQYIGPLSDSDLNELEPNVTFATTTASNDATDKKTSNVYLFPHEGFVDPCDAVRTMREEARKRGVSFLWNCTVQEIATVDAADQYPITNSSAHNRHQNYACTVENQNNHNGPHPTVSTIDADVIVIAAGIGSSNTAFGGLPMQQPINCSGCTMQYTHNINKNTAASVADESRGKSGTLQRVVVDMVNQAHILQRRNGTVVVGGDSPLRVGGTNDVEAIRTDAYLMKTTTTETVALAMKAQNLIPKIVETMIIDKTQVAERPIPLDGLPSIGFYPDMKSTKHGSGIYSLVSHSGITLAPLLGALAAIEIMDVSLTLDVLQPYRPERLFVRQQ